MVKTITVDEWNQMKSTWEKKFKYGSLLCLHVWGHGNNDIPPSIEADVIYPSGVTVHHKLNKGDCVFTCAKCGKVKGFLSSQLCYNPPMRGEQR